MSRNDRDERGRDHASPLASGKVSEVRPSIERAKEKAVVVFYLIVHDHLARSFLSVSLASREAPDGVGIRPGPVKSGPREDGPGQPRQAELAQDPGAPRLAAPVEVLPDLPRRRLGGRRGLGLFRRGLPLPLLAGLKLLLGLGELEGEEGVPRLVLPGVRAGGSARVWVWRGSRCGGGGRCGSGSCCCGGGGRVVVGGGLIHRQVFGRCVCRVLPRPRERGGAEPLVVVVVVVVPPRVWCVCV